MDGVEDFNSSELEFSSDDDPQPTHRRVSQDSIDKIIADAEKDRILAKKAIKKLQFGGAAPITTYTSSF